MTYAAIEDRRRAARDYARRRWSKDPASVKVNTDRYLTKLRLEVGAAKILRGCAHCGYRQNPDALEFDHIVPRRVTGERPIRYMNSRSELTNALANPNVQILCANCHAIKSVGERKARFPTITIDPS